MRKEIETKGSLTIYKDDREGYQIESSKTGLQYDLLELKSYHGKCTSDIVAIMVSAKEMGYGGMLWFFFGADFLQDTLDTSIDVISSFERGNEKLIEEVEIEELIAVLENRLDYVKQNNLKEYINDIEKMLNKIKE